jgi:hypothetical protein
LRYLFPALALAAPGLVLLAEQLQRRWKNRGLIYSGVVLCLWNIAYYIIGDDMFVSIYVGYKRIGEGLRCYVWYMEPFAKAMDLSRQWGTPLTWAQALIFCLFMLLAVWAFVRGYRALPKDNIEAQQPDPA